MDAPAFGSFAWTCAAMGRPSPCDHDRYRSSAKAFAKLEQLGVQPGCGGPDLALANCPDCKTTISRVIPLCEECDDTGGGEGEPACSFCTLGAVTTYEGERDFGRLPFRLGTLDEFLDWMVANRGLVDNRSRRGE